MSERPEPTGERLVPELQRGELVAAEHLARYRLATQLGRSRRVLDAACGEGYGTAMLAEAGAASAVGVDIDAATIERAGARYPDCRFVAADVTALPFEDGSFDLAVSFETIEHLTEPERLLDELQRVLAADGLLVISTPNKRSYLVENEFHEREFTHEEFVALLRERFPAVELLLQHNWLVSAVLDPAVAADDEASGAHELELYKSVGLRPAEELYTVAVCGRSVDFDARPVAVSASLDEAHALARRLVEAERDAARWHAEWEEAKRVAAHWHGEHRRAVESRSWKLTRPLRGAARLLRRGGG